MTDLYTVVCMQTNRVGIDHRREIRSANLDRCLEIFGYGALRLSFREYAPLRLVVFPEVFMQGWNDSAAPYANIFTKVAKDMAIRIPGEETELLAEQARRYRTYVAGSAHEVIPEISTEYAFNAGFIIDPNGEVVYKRHKYTPYLPYRGRDDVSPHDIWDRYVEFMDGKYGRKKGDILSCMFPVVETDIGKLGYLICNEGFYSEHSRAMGLQGCEVMIRSSGMAEPDGSPPQALWEVTNRAHAAFNMMYVVACAPGYLQVKGNPMNAYPGNSMVVDFHGAIIQQIPYPGESVTAAQISLEAIRRRRIDPRQNWLTQIRAEAFRGMYDKPIYPVNLYRDRLPTDQAERSQAQPIARFLEDGIFVPPTRRT
ncbi:MAG TPA: nitrilase-related carbon-nitrogen hydrolase [Hyphomicrobiaceae bacterium]|jgi:predicted amidohydrolase|nr:nitrilase-related carbon-nitrogen hydrolase [Hyphomicrobiaceae bacterium]